jgi:hypothetical protein
MHVQPNIKIRSALAGRFFRNVDTCLPNYTSSHRIIQCLLSYRIQIMRLANLTDVVSGYPSIQTCRGVSLEEDLTPYQSSCRLCVSPSSAVLSFRDRSEVQTKQASRYKGKYRLFFYISLEQCVVYTY